MLTPSELTMPLFLAGFFEIFTPLARFSLVVSLCFCVCVVVVVVCFLFLFFVGGILCRAIGRCWGRSMLRRLRLV